MQRGELIRRLAEEVSYTGPLIAEEIIRRNLAGFVLVEMETAEHIQTAEFSRYVWGFGHTCPICTDVDSENVHHAGCPFLKLSAAVEAAKGKP